MAWAFKIWSLSPRPSQAMHSAWAWLGFPGPAGAGFGLQAQTCTSLPPICWMVTQGLSLSSTCWMDTSWAWAGLNLQAHKAFFTSSSPTWCFGHEIWCHSFLHSPRTFYCFKQWSQPHMCTAQMKTLGDLNAIHQSCRVAPHQVYVNGSIKVDSLNFQFNPLSSRAEGFAWETHSEPLWYCVDQWWNWRRYWSRRYVFCVKFLPQYWSFSWKSGYHIGYICVVFSIPERALSIVFTDGIEVLEHLAYVKWYTPLLNSPEPNHLLYKVSLWKDRDGTHICSIILLANIHRSVHLYPKFGVFAPQEWSSSSVLDWCNTFFVNDFMDRHMYRIAC